MSEMIDEDNLDRIVPLQESLVGFLDTVPERLPRIFGTPAGDSWRNLD